MDKSVFDHEINALLTILVIFSSTYILRGVFDVWFNKFVNVHTFKGLLFAFLVAIICDFIPLAMFMIFHYKNFR